MRGGTVKTVWILNHYAGPPKLSTGIRHYKFAELLLNEGYDVKVFYA
jgi:hypothetical protein